MVIGFASCQKAVSATSQLAHVPKGSTYGLSCFLSLPLLYYSRHGETAHFTGSLAIITDNRYSTYTRIRSERRPRDYVESPRIDYMTMIHDRLNK